MIDKHWAFRSSAAPVHRRDSRTIARLLELTPRKALQLRRALYLGLVVDLLIGMSLLPVDRPILTSLIVLLVVMIAAVAASSLALKLYVFGTPERIDEIGYEEPSAPVHSFSIIVPARNALAVLPTTLEALTAQTHPNLEILVVVSGDDDELTRAAAERAARKNESIRLLYAYGTKNKPRALNIALPVCKGDIVGVIDRESVTAPDLLRNVDSRFQTSGADTVISGVALMNIQSSWFSLQNCLEYDSWFGSRLHYQAKHGVVPYSGNTIFIRTELLQQLDGWDPDCLAEDCELGFRASAIGARTSVAFDHRLVTKEETPGNVRELLHQRVRWMQGFLQTFKKGVWKRLPTWRQRMLARYTLLMPFMQALTGILMPLAPVTAYWLKLPTALALLTYLPLVPALAALVADGVGLHRFMRKYGIKARLRDYSRLALGFFPYQFILATAAVMAVVREVQGKNNWFSPELVGAHHENRQQLAEGAA